MTSPHNPPPPATTTPANVTNVSLAMPRSTAVLGLLLLGAAAPEPVPFQHILSGWLITCDNTISCDVRTTIVLPGAGTPPPTAFTLIVTRDAGPGAAPALTIVGEGDLPRPSPNAPPSPGPLAIGQLRLDGRDEPPAGWVHSGGQRTASLGGAMALVQALATTRVGTLVISGTEYPLPLKGLSPALALVDAAQGRTGTDSAVIDPGPPGPVPPAPRPPTVHAATPPPPLANPAQFARAVRAATVQLMAGFPCDPLSETAPQDRAAPLNGQEALVIIACTGNPLDPAGFPMRVRRDNPASAQLLRLPPNPPFMPGRLFDHILLPASAIRYDPQTATLRMGFTRRAPEFGTACGIAFEWLFDGTTFVASAAAAQYTCLTGPAPFPVLYRTQRRR